MVLLNISYVLLIMTALLQKIVSAPRIPDRPSALAEPFELNEPNSPPHYYKFLDGNYILKPKYKKHKTRIFSCTKCVLLIYYYYFRTFLAIFFLIIKKTITTSLIK